MTSTFRCALGAYSITACLMLAACPASTDTPPAAIAPFGGYEGIVAMDGVVMTDNRCTLSVLYSDFTPAQIKGATDGRTVKRGFALRGSPHIAGAPVKVMLRGAYLGSSGPVGKIELQYGNVVVANDFVLDATSTSGDILMELDGKASDGTNSITVTVTLPLPATPDAEQAIHVDSIDLALEGDFCKSAP